MSSSALITKEIEIRSRLHLLDTAVNELREIVIAAANGRSLRHQNDPKSAPGQFAYIFGCRQLREVFLAKNGWESCSDENIEGVYNPHLNVKIIVQTVDLAASSRFPRLLHPKKGSGFINMVENAQQNLLPEIAAEEKRVFEFAKRKHSAAVYLLMVSFNGLDGESIRAELSKPTAIEGLTFPDMHERIAIIDSDNFDYPLRKADAGHDENVISDPVITRKR